MSPNNPESNPSEASPRVDFDAFRKASNVQSRAMLEEERQKLQKLQVDYQIAQNAFIKSVDRNDTAYPHLVTFFGGNLDDPRIDETAPECLMAMFSLLECIDERHPSRKYLEKFVEVGSDIDYISGSISDLEMVIEHNS